MTAKTQICKAMRCGLSLADAAAYAGVSESQLAEWGRTDAQFAKRIKRAEVQFELECLKKIRRGARDWPEAARWLETRFPKKWGPPPGAAVQLTITVENSERESHAC